MNTAPAVVAGYPVVVKQLNANFAFFFGFIVSCARNNVLKRVQ